jgi:hypothetical protein
MMPYDLAHSTAGSTALVLLSQPRDSGHYGCQRPSALQQQPACCDGGLEGEAPTTTNLVDNGALDDATDAAWATGWRVAWIGGMDYGAWNRSTACISHNDRSDCRLLLNMRHDGGGARNDELYC